MFFIKYKEMYFEATNQSLTGSLKASNKNSENSCVTDHEGSSLDNEKLVPKEKKKSTFYSSIKNELEIEKNLIKDLTPKVEQNNSFSNNLAQLIEKEEVQNYTEYENEIKNVETNINQEEENNFQIFLEKKNELSTNSKHEQTENLSVTKIQDHNQIRSNIESCQPLKISQTQSGKNK